MRDNGTDLKLEQFVMKPLLCDVDKKYRFSLNRLNESLGNGRDALTTDRAAVAAVPGEATHDSGIATATGPVATTTGVTTADVMKKFIEEEGAASLISKFAENIGKITHDYSGWCCPLPLKIWSDSRFCRDHIFSVAISLPIHTGREHANPWCFL